MVRISRQSVVSPLEDTTARSDRQEVEHRLPLMSQPGFRAPTADVVGSGPRPQRRYLGLPPASSLATPSACSGVNSPALSMSWSRSRFVIEREAFAALRIFTAAGVDLGLTFFDIACLLDG